MEKKKLLRPKSLKGIEWWGLGEGGVHAVIVAEGRVRSRGGRECMQGNHRVTQPAGTCKYGWFLLRVR